jgi:hypothetical protein
MNLMKNSKEGYTFYYNICPECGKTSLSEVVRILIDKLAYYSYVFRARRGSRATWEEHVRTYLKENDI